MSADKAWVNVLVRDTGIGIPTDLQPRVFELLAQADRSSERSQGGLGIGLALVKSLVELHDGSVGVTSEGADRGSTFTVRLPRLPIEAVSPLDPAGQVPADQTDKGLDVLVVDDNVDAAEMLRLWLEQGGHRVRVAYDPQQALTLTAKQAPDVALVDIGLLGMDGYELVWQLRQQHGDRSLCVAMTGYGQPADRTRALESGFDEHLAKPANTFRLA